MTGIAELYKEILSNSNISITPQSAEWIVRLEQAYDTIHAKLPDSSTFKGSKILAPVVLFMFFKMSAVFINAPTYFENVGIERRKFLSYLNKIKPLCEEYSLRDRRAYVDNVIKSVIESFELGSEFQSRCEEILDVFFSQLKNTTEEMIAAMVCVLSKIMLDKKEPIIKKLCDHVGVGAGSINTFFKKKLAKSILGADEFKGFVKSSELIKVNCLKILDNKKKLPKKPIEKKPIKKKPMEKKPIEKKEKAIAPPQKEINFKDMFSRISKKLYMELESELLGYLEGVPGISIELISLMTSEITEKSLELFSEALKSVKLMKKE